MTGIAPPALRRAHHHPPDGHLVVISLRDLPDELKPAGTLLTLDAIWRRVTDPDHRRRRLVLIDEAWLLMRDPEGARFLFRAAKSARKHWCGLTVVTQDAADLLGTDLGQAVVANAATQILLRQAPQTIDALSDAFGLSDGERAFLLAARQGEGLLAAGPQTAGVPDRGQPRRTPTGHHQPRRTARSRTGRPRTRPLIRRSTHPHPTRTATLAARTRADRAAGPLADQPRRHRTPAVGPP